MYLGDLIINYDSKRIPLSSKQRESIEKIYPYYGAQGIIDYVDDYIFDGEYMLIAEDGENLRSRKLPIASIVSGKFWVNNHAHIVMANKDSNLRFLCYWLNSNDISRYLTGSAQPKLNQANLNIIPLPDLTKTKQDRIAAIISLYEEKISLNLKEISLLIDAINLMYKSWFNDFNYPNETRELALSDKLNRKVPISWKIITFRKFLTPYTEKIKDLDAKIYSTTNNGISLRDERFTKNLTKTRSNNKKVVKDDLIFGLSREILNFGVFPDEIGSVSPAYQIFKIDQSIILPFMLDLEIRTNMSQYMDILQLGAREGQGIRKKYLLDKYFLVPEMKLQKEFAKVYEIYQKKIANLKKENSVLAEIRDTLLPKLINGELPVKEGEE